jgi:hypothetical protein
MQYRVDFITSVTNGPRRIERCRRRWTARWVAVALMGMMVSTTRSQEMMPGMESVVDPGAPPITDFGGGDYFSQDLGTTLRVRYNTESYGQHGDGHGNVDIGTMQMANFEDAVVFFDGQVTLNDVQGVGFNLGVGYRWMDFPSYGGSPGRMQGVSIWADGASTEANNFFPQVGVSYEALGEMWDMRLNTYIPLGSEDQVGDFVPTAGIGFEGNNISQLTQAVVDSSFFAGEAEVARRLGPNRDAWAFAGPYFLANNSDDSAGYRVGLRGYAYPDLLLQLAVSNDDIFDTNATFSMIWFVGRTRTDFQPACGVPDRFREPVLRNDYVVLAQSTTFGGIALTQPDGDALRIVHVDSNAGPGGDGTFENPFDMLTDVDEPGNSQAGDIIFVHSQSVFNGDNITLLDDQRLLGEGLDADGEPLEHTVATAEEGTIEIPESAPGARNLDRPMIVDAIGDAITVANNNEVANFDIEGGDSAVVGTNLTGMALVHDLSVLDALADAIVFDTVADEVTLRDIQVTNGNGFGISLTNFETDNTATLSDYTYDGGVAAAGGLELVDFDGAFSTLTSSFTNGTLAGVAITGDSDGIITFQDTVEFNSIDGTAFDVNGFTGTLNVNSDITNDTGRSVSVQAVSDAGTTVTFNGDITDTGQGILVSNNSGGTILFSGDLGLDTGANPAAITVTNNTGADINFGGEVDITTTTGSGIVATGGGTLTVSNTANSISSDTGQLAQIVGMTISSLGVNIADVNRTGVGATSAILLDNNLTGPITFGMTTDAVGDAGTIAGGLDDAIVIRESANVSVTGVRINNTNPVSGVRIEKFNTNASTINLSDMQINSGDIGVEVLGGGTGLLTMSLNDTDMIGSTLIGLDFNNVDAGTVAVNNATVDGNSFASTAGIRISNSNAAFNIDQNTEIREVDGTDFLVDGGSGTINMNGDIINAMAMNVGDTIGRSAVIQNITGGTVTLSPQNSITDDNQGILINNNTGGTINLQGTNALTTDTFDAVTITNNSGANVTLSNLTIATTTGSGFVATSGGTLAVLGTTNTINTTTGVGLQIENMTIANTGVSFQSVTVSSGLTNAIFLENLTGTGQVSVGNAGGAPASGGTLTTNGEAVVLRNVQNVDLRNIRIANSNSDGLLIEHTSATATAMDVTLDFLDIDSTAGDGIDITADSDTAEFRLRLRDGDLEENVATEVTGGGTFFLLVEDTDIDIAAGAAADAFSLQFSDTARNGEVTFRDNNSFAAAAGKALFIDSDGSAAKTVNLLIDDSDFFSSTNAIAAAEIRSRSNTTMNATIEGNMFDAPASANDFDMRTDTATGRIRLKLGDADAADMNVAGGGGGTFILRETAGDFDVFEQNDTIVLDNRNSGAVNVDPNNPALFDNLPSPPPTPALP